MSIKLFGYIAVSWSPLYRRGPGNNNGHFLVPGCIAGDQESFPDLGHIQCKRHAGIPIPGSHCLLLTAWISTSFAGLLSAGFL